MKKIWIIISMAGLLLICLGLRNLYFSYYPNIEIDINAYQVGEMSCEIIGSTAIPVENDEVKLKISKFMLNSEQVRNEIYYKYKHLNYRKIDIEMKVYEKDGYAVSEYYGTMIDDKNNKINYNRKFEYDFSLHKIEVRDFTD